MSKKKTKDTTTGSNQIAEKNLDLKVFAHLMDFVRNNYSHVRPQTGYFHTMWFC